MHRSVWGVGDNIAAHFDLALQGLSALDHFVRHSICSVSNAAAQNGFGDLRGMTLTEWEIQRRGQVEYEERAAVMKLYAAFEGLLRRDAAWRGLESAAHLHNQFNRTAQKVINGKFVRLSEWLNCWQAMQLPPVQVAVLNQLEITFRNDRNPLMHTDRAIFPPFVRVHQQMIQACLCLFTIVNNDFGACDAP